MEKMSLPRFLKFRLRVNLFGLLLVIGSTAVCGLTVGYSTGYRKAVKDLYATPGKSYDAETVPPDAEEVSPSDIKNVPSESLPVQHQKSVSTTVAP